MKIRSLIFFLPLLIISSCASDNVVSTSIIQKRKYTKGYTIWGNKTNKKATAKSQTKKSTVYVANLSTEVLKYESNPKVDSIKMCDIVSDTAAVKSNKNGLNSHLSDFNEISLPQHPADTAFEIPTKADPVSKISFASGVLGLIALSLNLWGIAFALGITAVVTGIVVIATNDKNYKRKTSKLFAGFGLSFGCISVLLVLGGLLLFWLLL